MKRIDISLAEIDELSAYYLSLVVEERELAAELVKSGEETHLFLHEFPKEKWEFRYAPGKWTPKETIQHLIDTERIFAYRSLRFARADTTSLPGFDMNKYAGPSLANRRSWEELTQEYQINRNATVALFRSFTEEMLVRTGDASGLEISVATWGFRIVGHDIHHCQILKERYL